MLLADRTLPRPGLGSRYRYVPIMRCFVLCTKGDLVIRTVLSVQVGLVIRTKGGLIIRIYEKAFIRTN